VGGGPRGSPGCTHGQVRGLGFRFGLLGETRGRAQVAAFAPPLAPGAPGAVDARRSGHSEGGALLVTLVRGAERGVALHAGEGLLKRGAGRDGTGEGGMPRKPVRRMAKEWRAAV